MNARLALALLVAIVTAVPASGAANLVGGEQRSRQSYDLRRVSPAFTAPPPAAPDLRDIPPPSGWPRGFLPLSLPYQRPWVN